MHITLNGDAREFPLDTTVVELLDTLGYAGKRVAVERNGEIVPRASTRKPRWPTATRSRSWWRWAGLNARRRADPARPRKGCGNAALLLYKARRRGLGVMICRKRRQSMSRTGLSRNAAGRHNP